MSNKYAVGNWVSPTEEEQISMEPFAYRITSVSGDDLIREYVLIRYVYDKKRKCNLFISGVCFL